ncbi:MAG TPA: hypothetical protein VF834_21630 [Streptosporangiaceae bacterium]
MAVMLIASDLVSVTRRRRYCGSGEPQDGDYQVAQAGHDAQAAAGGRDLTARARFLGNDQAGVVTLSPGCGIKSFADQLSSPYDRIEVRKDIR